MIKILLGGDQIVPCDLKGHIRHDGCQLFGKKSVIFIFYQFLEELIFGQFIQVIIEIFNGVVTCQQFQCRFLSDPCHTGNIIGSVAH